ncbi:MAG: hypothetical protein K2Q26_12065 [Bdellovibrionales bacterium]|nr:hypothetical protein [Bdellovibrionales bacterium]
MKVVLSIVLFFIFNSAFASENAIERFEKWFIILDRSLDDSLPKEEAALALTDDLSRIAAFNLQALAKIYKDEASLFPELREDAKDLEDAIGEFKKWDDMLEAAKKKGNLEKIKSLTAKRQEGLTALGEVLYARNSKGKSWLAKNATDTKISYYREKLSKYDWGSEEEDKSFVIRRLSKALKKISETDFDFTYLEEGDGLHEFRRELRWFAIEAQVLNGLVTFDPANTCTNSAYRPLLTQPIAKSKYATLPVNPKVGSPCRISKCLFLGVADLVDKVGKIKDDVEEELIVNSTTNDDITPAKYKKKVEEFYDHMHKNDLLPELREELKACI